MTPRIRTAGFFFLSGILTASWSSRIPDIQRKLSLDDAAWGRVLVAQPLGLVTGLLFSTWLMAHFGSVRIMRWSTLLNCFLLCALGLASSPGLLMLALYAYGTCRTILSISANTNAIEVQQSYTKPIIATFHGLWSLACLSAAALGILMVKLELLTIEHFIIVAIPCFILALLTYRKGEPLPAPTQERKQFFKKPDRFLWILGAMCFGATLIESAMFEWSINYFEKRVHAPGPLAGAALNCFLCFMAAGRLVGDKLIQRFGQQTMLITNAVLAGCGFLLTALIPLPVPAFAGLILIGLGDSIMIPIIYSLAARTKKMEAGYAISCVTLIGYTGFVSGPMIIGSISKSANMSWAFMVVGLIVLIIPFLTLYLKSFPEMDQASS